MNKAALALSLAAGSLLAAPARATDAFSAATYPASGVKKILVETDSGAIDVEPSDDAAVSVDVAPAASPGDDCRVERKLEKDKGVLRLSARAVKGPAGVGIKATCAAGFSVKAPARLEVTAASGSGAVTFGAFSGKAEATTGSGAIKVDGASGALTLRSGSGDVSGSASGPSVDAKTGSGGVSLDSLTGVVKVQTGSGAVALSWTTAPAKGAIDVRTGSGDFTAILPAGAKAKASLSSASGRIDNALGSDPKASLSLTFRSGSGAATISRAP